MILPIDRPFNRAGLPGQGVPALTIDPATGDIYEQDEYLSAYGADPGAGPTDAAAATAAPEPELSDPNLVNSGGLLQTHGERVWDFPGSWQDETGFDYWRRAGRPTACGMGAYTFPDGTPCDPGMSDPSLCLDSAERILLAVGAGAGAAAQTLRPMPPFYAPYPGQGLPPGSVAVTGQASPVVWIVGGLLAVALISNLMRRN